MSSSIPVIVSVVSCVLALSSASFAIFVRWKASVEKGYAAQRDFAHLQRNFEQLNQSMQIFLKDQKEGFDSLSDGLKEGFQAMAKDQDARSHRLELGQSELRMMVSSLNSNFSSNSKKKEE